MKRTKTDLIVIHCSATGPHNANIGRDEINDMHVDRGWSGIGRTAVAAKRDVGIGKAAQSCDSDADGVPRGRMKNNFDAMGNFHRRPWR